MATTLTKTAAESIVHPYSNIPTSTTSTTKPTTSQPPYTFSFTPFLRQNALASLTSTVPICPAFASGHCPLGRRCPDRHPTPSQQPQHHYGRGNDNFVCKHWLKGLCKKGDACDYLHEYNLRKMSECQFYNQNGYCQNGDECLYVHVKEDSKLPLCEDYNSGFCAKGPRCGKRHVRRRLCPFYLAGFCPDGKQCTHGVHLKGATAEGKTEDENEKARKERVAEVEKRDDEPKKEFGWKGGRGGRGGRWKNKRDRRGQSEELVKHTAARRDAHPKEYAPKERPHIILSTPASECQNHAFYNTGEQCDRSTNANGYKLMDRYRQSRKSDTACNRPSPVQDNNHCQDTIPAAVPNPMDNPDNHERLNYERLCQMVEKEGVKACKVDRLEAIRTTLMKM